jgi:serine/threonine protein kinase
VLHAWQVADFGLSRQSSSSTVDTDTYGTVTHMPPELLMEGKLTKSADVYAFGVLLWEMYTGSVVITLFKRMILLPPSTPHSPHPPPCLSSPETQCHNTDGACLPPNASGEVLEVICLHRMILLSLTQLIASVSMCTVFQKGSKTICHCSLCCAVYFAASLCRVRENICCKNISMIHPPTAACKCVCLLLQTLGEL